MEKGTIPIYENTGRIMGLVVWNGKLVSGTWRFSPDKELDEFSRRRVQEQIKFLPEARQDLSQMRYRGPNGRMYRGWSGFVGLLGAFGVALPALGMFIERTEAKWPIDDTSEEPRGIDVIGEVTGDEQEQEYRTIQAEQELQEHRQKVNGNKWFDRTQR